MTDAEVCLNCDTPLKGKFCHDCGQKVIEPNERTIKYFIYQFFGSAFFLENNFLKNLWTLVSRPGRLTLDFMEGRRKRWMPPFSLFLLINLFYFWYTPLTDLNLSLKEQLNQHHGAMAQAMVKNRIENRNITLDEYGAIYNQKSTGYSNSLIILQIPIFASFLMLIFYRKKMFFVDHFIYALHFFAFVLFIALIQSGIVYLMMDGEYAWKFSTWLFLILILGFTFLSVRNAYRQTTAYSLISVPFVLVAFLISHFIYRTILFLIIFAAT